MSLHDVAPPAPPPLARVAPPRKPLPALRLLAAAVRNPIEMWPEAMYREPVYSRRFAGRNAIFLCDPELIRAVLVDQADAFVKGDGMRRALEPALGRGLLTAEGERWRGQRRAASPIFRHERILGFGPQMIAAAERVAERWRGRAGQEVDVAREMMGVTYDIIAGTMLGGGGSDPARIERAISDYLEPLGWVVAMSVARAPGWLPYPGKAKGARATRFLRAEIARVIEARQASGEARDDLLGLLIAARDPETGERMSATELVDNVLTFINAGHETTALALTWTFYLLDRRPEVATRVRDEIASVAGEGPLLTEHAAAMTYTRAVIFEAMRLYPPAAVVIREAARPLDLGGLPVEAGAQVFVPIYALHRHETLWPEPDVFDPERFSAQGVKARRRYAYLPFGAGSRICIGMTFALMEATLILATLLRAFRPRLRAGYEPKLALRVTLRPAGGMPMTLERV